MLSPTVRSQASIYTLRHAMTAKTMLKLYATYSPKTFLVTTQIELMPASVLTNTKNKLSDASYCPLPKKYLAFEEPVIRDATSFRNFTQNAYFVSNLRPRQEHADRFDAC